MLVLTRKDGEAVRIGPDVEVVVVEILRGQVRLGFRAPRSVQILRTELISKPNTQQGDGEACRQ